MKPHERIKAVIDHYGLNKNSFSKEIGYNQNTTIGRLINEGRVPSSKTVKMITARFPEVSYDWLITGRGDMLTEPNVPINERLQKLYDFAGKSARQIAEEIGLSYGVVKAIEQGRNSNINQDIANKISKTYPGVSKDFMLTGKGDFLNQNNEAQLIPFNYMKVPKVPIHAQAGFLVGYGDVEYIDELPTEIWEVDTEYKGKYICFEVKGDSMDNGTTQAFLEGDKLLCREIQQHHWKNKLHLKKWNFVIAHRTEGVLIKRITEHETDKGVVKCHSLNEFYDDVTINLNDVVALFNVVDMKRKPIV